MHTVFMSCVVVTLVAAFLAVGVLMLDITSNPYNYRIPPYSAYLSKAVMKQHEETERFIKRQQRTMLAVKLLGVFVLWVLALSFVIGGQVIF